MTVGVWGFRTPVFCSIEDAPCKTRPDTGRQGVVHTGKICYTYVHPRNMERGNVMQDYILIAEDDNDISRMLKELLEQNGYRIQQAYSGTEAKLYMEREQPAAVILDLMLPGMSGEEVLAWIKREIPSTAVLVASAKDTVQMRIALLRAGADDYIVKPFDTDELTARLEAVLRRSGKSADLTAAQEAKASDTIEKSSAHRLIYKDIIMQPEDFSITVGDAEVSLTRREYLILALLMEHPGKVFTKSNIYESVWNEEFLGEDNAVNVHISNIRQKLAKINPAEAYIQTVWGIGFKMK